MPAKIDFHRALFSAAMFAVLISARAVAADDAVSLIKVQKFEEALETLKSTSQPTTRQSGMLCYLYVNSYVAADAANAKRNCDAAVAGHDPLGLYESGTATFRPNAPAGFAHNEQIALGEMAEAVKLDYYPAYEWLCRYFYEKADYSDASSFCKVAAVNQRPSSAYYLGLMLFGGNGAVQDFRKARQFTLSSAQMNYAPAYKLLGDLSREGKWGVKKDLIQAYAWYALASSAAPDWHDPVQMRDALNLSSDEVARAQRLSAEWVTKPAPSLL